MATIFELDSQTFAVGENLPHAILVLDGFIYLGLRTNPGKLLKISITDLSYSVLTFPDDSGKYAFICQIRYSLSKGKIYCLCENSTRIVLREVDPSDLSDSDVIDSGNYGAGNGSFALDESYVYIAARDSDKIVKYDMSNWAEVDNAAIAAKAHAIEYSDNFLYITHAANPGAVTKVNAATLALSSNIFAAGDWIATDDFAIVGDFMWVGLETTNGRILKIAKADLSIIAVETARTVACWGVFYDGTSVWCAYSGTPGSLVQIDPSDNTVTVYDNLANALNEIVFSGNSLFVSSYLVPAKITEYSLEAPMSTLSKKWTASVELAKTNFYGGTVADLAADQAYDYTSDVDLETNGYQGIHVTVEFKASGRKDKLHVDVFASLDGSAYDTIPFQSYVLDNDSKDEQFSFIVKDVAHFRIGLKTSDTNDTFDYRITYQTWNIDDS